MTYFQSRLAINRRESPLPDFAPHAARLKAAALIDLADSSDSSSLLAAGWRANLARQFIDNTTIFALLTYANDAGLPKSINALFAGKTVNPSEKRPALHWALRAPKTTIDAAGKVRNSLTAGDAFAEDIRNGIITGANGHPFKNIVHIGIGGSDFGPRLLSDAFRKERDRKFELRFCANLDPLDLDLALDGLNPTETLIIGVSKSFGTEETLYNLTRAKDWLTAGLGPNTPQHLALITSRPDRAKDWLGGIDATTFDMPESIGGRFSIWSNASLALAITLGADIIKNVRNGAADMDTHFRDTPLERNLPVRLALLDYWNSAVLGHPMRVVLAYAHRLRMLPTYLQQLEMESNGKSVQPSGEPTMSSTAPALWGGEGSVGQHSYHQWLHQGTRAVPTEFILALDANAEETGQQALIAHALAQAEVLANGRDLESILREEPDLPESIAKQKVHQGGRPSTFLSHSDFGPHAFGALLALYEHRTYVAGILWGVNSFDQWGVEAGKTMAGKFKTNLSGKAPFEDTTTQSIVDKL